MRMVLAALLLAACALPALADSCEDLEARLELLESREVEVLKVLESMEIREVEMARELGKLRSELEGEVRSALPGALRALPYLTTCAAATNWGLTGTIVYDRLITDFNNGDQPEGGRGEMDITTGTFTAGTAGHYTVTFSGVAEQDHENSYMTLWLFKNGFVVQDGFWFSRSGTNSGTFNRQTNSRTLVGLAWFFVVGEVTLSAGGSSCRRRPSSCSGPEDG